ncbi:MAG: DUF362 domain-containing protein [Thermoleophilia bacterium]
MSAKARQATGKVAVLKTKPATVDADIAQLFDLADGATTLDAGATTILKDNISWHMPFLSANTTPWQLEGTIHALRGAGFADLVAVHNDTVVTNPVKGERLNKLAPVYARTGIQELYNNLPGNMRWVTYEPQAKMLALNHIFPEGIELPDFFFAKNIVHLPTVKCHIYTTTTGAMKNAFGGLLARRRHYAHSWIHETLVDLLAIQQEIHSGIFAVMDGTLSGNGPGPRTMQPVETDYMLASADQVAIDAVAAKMMGFDPLSIKYIRLAHERGLGIGDPREIEVVGADVNSVNFGFSVGANLPASFGRLAWFGPMHNLQHLLFHTPLVNAFVFASFFYHDYVWWPLKGRRIMADVRRQTKWGRYFDDYPT